MNETTKRGAQKIAESFGCQLEAEWSGLEWIIELWAPDGQWFKGTDCSVDCSIAGAVDLNERRPDWKTICDSIKNICANGFQPSDYV